MYADSVTYHGFVRQPNGRYARIDYPGATYTMTRGNNNRGVIVGDFGDPME